MRFTFKVLFSILQDKISRALHLNYVCPLLGIKLKLDPASTSPLQRGERVCIYRKNIRKSADLAAGQIWISVSYFTLLKKENSLLINSVDTGVG